MVRYLALPNLSTRSSKGGVGYESNLEIVFKLLYCMYFHTKSHGAILFGYKNYRFTPLTLGNLNSPQGQHQINFFLKWIKKAFWDSIAPASDCGTLFKCDMMMNDICAAWVGLKDIRCTQSSHL